MNQSPVQLPLPRTRKVISAAAFVADMKESMRAMVAGSGLSRDQFVDAMNEYARLAGRGREEAKTPLISLATLDKLLADEERGQLPTLWILEVMSRVAESLAAQETWLAMHGCGVMDETARLKVAFAEDELERTVRAERRKNLKKKLLEGR